VIPARPPMPKVIPLVTTRTRRATVGHADLAANVVTQSVLSTMRKSAPSSKVSAQRWLTVRHQTARVIHMRSGYFRLCR
jgi:hypothetical protein